MSDTHSAYMQELRDEICEAAIEYRHQFASGKWAHADKAHVALLNAIDEYEKEKGDD